VAAGVLIGLVWFRLDIYSIGQANIMSVMGVFIMLATLAVFDNMLSLLVKFPVTRALHLREYSNGYYNLLPYYFASVLSSLMVSAIYQVRQSSVVSQSLSHHIVKSVVYWGGFGG
jgi:hypothetical protein